RRIGSQFVQVLQFRDIVPRLSLHGSAQRLRFKVGFENSDAVQPMLHVAPFYENASTVPLLHGERRQFRRRCSEQVQGCGTVAASTFASAARSSSINCNSRPSALGTSKSIRPTSGFGRMPNTRYVTPLLVPLARFQSKISSKLRKVRSLEMSAR